jgi:hypothetical protein
MQGVAFDVGDHPLGILAPAQTVVVHKLFFRRYVQPVEVAASACAAIFENRVHLARRNAAYLGHRKAGKVDK